MDLFCGCDLLGWTYVALVISAAIGMLCVIKERAEINWIWIRRKKTGKESIAFFKKIILSSNFLSGARRVLEKVRLIIRTHNI